MSSTNDEPFVSGGDGLSDSHFTENGNGVKLMIQLKRIKSESVVQQIIDSLVEAMIRKELRPGDQIDPNGNGTCGESWGWQKFREGSD